MNEVSLKQNLGLNIKKIRCKHGLTQEAFSEKIGITQRQISLIELGKSFPSPNTLLNIVKNFNCEIIDLFNFKKEISIQTKKDELMRLIEILPDEKINFIYTVAKNI